MAIKLYRIIVTILRRFRFPIGVIGILFLALNFISSHPPERVLLHSDVSELNEHKSFTGTGMSGSQSEAIRVELNEPLVISGYSTERKGLVRTLVTYKGSPVLLSRKMMSRDIENKFDLVRMRDGRVFFCVNQSNDNCWLVLIGDRQLPFS